MVQLDAKRPRPDADQDGPWPRSAITPGVAGVSVNGLTTGEASRDSGSGVVAVGSESKRRILFVDDEQAILEGLRSILRPQRREWDMVFALAGQPGSRKSSASPST